MQRRRTRGSGLKAGAACLVIGLAMTAAAALVLTFPVASTAQADHGAGVARQEPHAGVVVPLQVVEGPGVRTGRDVQPRGTVYGDCGYAWMNLYDVYEGDGMGMISYGAHSTKGIMVTVSYVAELWHYGMRLNYWSGIVHPFNSTWSRVYDFSISPWGPGYYTGILSYLDVWTALGYHCIGLMPSDTYWIS